MLEYRRRMRIDSEKKIKSVDIHLKGFNMKELKDIIGYIRSVEAHRESRVVFVNFDASDDNVGEALKKVLDLWPEEEGPPFTYLGKRRKDSFKNNEPRLCWICGAQCKKYLVTCSDDCHEKLIQRLEKEFGSYKKVIDIETGKSYKVPTREIIEEGLIWGDLKKYPEWRDKENSKYG